MPLSPEQHAIRARGIGGSEIAEVAGLTPWGGPINIWQKKLGIAPPRDVNHHMLRGIHLGPALVQWYADKTEKHITHVGRHEKTFTHPDHPVCIATPDGLIHRTPDSKPSRAVEAKAVWRAEFADWGEPGTEEVPEHYLPQTSWESAAGDLEGTDLIVPLDGDLAAYPIDRNQKLFEALLHVAERFWHDYVLTKKEPPIDASKAARDYLSRRYPKATADIVEATEEQIDWIRQRNDARLLGKQIDETISTFDNLLRRSIGEHEGLSSAIATVKWGMRDGRVNWKSVAEAALSQLPLSADQRKEFEESHRGSGYRHFQIYPKKAKKK